MARLLQIFGFLSVLFRGAILTFQSLAAGGIVFLVLILRGAHPESDAIRHSCLRWIRRAAIALAAMRAAYGTSYGAMVSARSRWLELRLPPENRTRNAMGRLGPACIVSIGAILLNYGEM
jgi:hypothetical protein